MNVDLREADSVEPSETGVRIMRAAMTLFARKGFEATTIKEITMASKVTPAALYLYFDSKDSLLSKLIESGYRKLMKLLESSIEDADRDEVDGDLLAPLVRAIVHFNTEYRTIAKVSDREWRNLRTAERNHVAGLRRQVRDQFERAIEVTLAKRDATRQADSAATNRLQATAILNMCAAVSDWYDPSGDLTADEIADAYCSFAVRLVEPDA